MSEEGYSTPDGYDSQGNYYHGEQCPSLPSASEEDFDRGLTLTNKVAELQQRVLHYLHGFERISAVCCGEEEDLGTPLEISNAVLDIIEEITGLVFIH